MIPSIDSSITKTITIETEPSKTYDMWIEEGRVRGMTDGIEAVKQTIYRILQTERYKYAMYDWNYGIELEDLFGKHMSYVIPEVERRIKDALSVDDRILSVDGFNFETGQHDLHVTFTAHTIYGDTEIEKEVAV